VRACDPAEPVAREVADDVCAAAGRAVLKNADGSGVEPSCYRPVMTIYRLRSFGPTGRIISVHKLSAADDQEARAQASEMVRGASGVATFDLWEDDRRIHGAAPTMREKPRR